MTRPPTPPKGALQSRQRGSFGRRRITRTKTRGRCRSISRKNSTSAGSPRGSVFTVETLTGELGRAPVRVQPALELGTELGDGDARLVERVAVAQRDRLVLERLVVDRDAARRADLVLAPVALADRAAGVELGGHQLAQVLVDPARELGLAVLVHQRQ